MPGLQSLRDHRLELADGGGGGEEKEEERRGGEGGGRKGGKRGEGRRREGGVREWVWQSHSQVVQTSKTDLCFHCYHGNRLTKKEVILVQLFHIKATNPFTRQYVLCMDHYGNTYLF